MIKPHVYISTILSLFPQDDQLEDALDLGGGAAFTMLEQAGLDKRALADIQSRHQNIQKLEESIKELHEMFMDMEMLVTDQVKSLMPLLS
jgi:t-SNARE complex subunit (syntaxin)